MGHDLVSTFNDDATAYDISLGVCSRDYRVGSVSEKEHATCSFTQTDDAMLKI